MAGFRFGFGSRSRLPPAAAINPPPVPTKLAIEGDSITAAHGYQSPFIAAHTSLTIRDDLATSGATIGQSSDAAGANTLFGRLATVIAAAPDVLTILIGANDLCVASSTVDWMTRLYQYVDAVHAALPNCKIGIATVLPSTEASHVTNGHNAKRATVNAQLRADVGLHHNFLIPLGDDPLAGLDTSPDDTNYFNTDKLHPNSGGHARYALIYAAVLDPIFAQASGNNPSAFTLTDQNNVALGSTQIARTTVTGMGVAQSAAASRSGAGTFARGIAAQGTSGFNVMNGDVVTLQLTASGSSSTTVSETLTIGSRSDSFDVTTTAATAAAAFIATGNKHHDDKGGFTAAAHVFNAIPFPAGVPVFALYRNVDPTNNPATTGVVGGVACRKVASSGNYSIWVGESALPAGNYAVTVTTSGLNNLADIYPGALTNIGSNVETGTSILASVYRAGPADFAGASSLTVGTGGIAIAFVQSQTAITNFYAFTQDAAYGDSWYFAHGSANGAPTFRSTGYGNTAVIAASFNGGGLGAPAAGQSADFSDPNNSQYLGVL